MGVMRDLPIFIDMRERPAVVVGGGVVAARRAELLVALGARGSPPSRRELSDEFLELRARPNFRHEPRDPAAEDFAGSALCFIATDDERLDRSGSGDGETRPALLVNVADRPESPISSCPRSSTAARW